MEEVEYSMPEDHNKENIKRTGLITENGEPVMLHVEGHNGAQGYAPLNINEEEPPAGDEAQRIEKRMDPKQPEIEARLREIGIMKKYGRVWRIVYIEILRILGEYYNNFNETRHKITAEEVAYAIFLHQVPDPKERKRVAYITYILTPSIVVSWVVKEPRAKKGKQGEKPGKFRAGGQLIDNIQKSNKPKTIQLNLFDTILQETREKMNGLGVTAEYINRKGEGIKLSKGEFRLLLCLSKLLHEKSQTQDKNSKDYYTGDSGYEVIKWNTGQGEIEVIAPKISLTLYEVSKEYYGDKEIGGENVRTVARMLFDMADNQDKKALIRYNRVVNLDKNRTREYFIERYESLISIATAGYREYLYGSQIDEKKELVVILHPVIRDQIETKSVDFPLDLTKRMIEAYGSPDISEITTKLMLELARAHSGRRALQKDEEGNYIYSIGVNTLYWKIADNYMNANTGKTKRGPLIKKYFDKSIETCKTLGLLVKHEIKTGKSGEQIVDFYLSLIHI